MPINCRACGRFIKHTPKRKVHCNTTCYGLAQRGRSRADRTSPSRKEYVMIRHKDGSREYLHRYLYRVANNDVIFSDEVIHHVNEDKRDNRPKNLGKVKAEAHTPHTHRKWKKQKELTYDKEFGW